MWCDLGESVSSPICDIFRTLLNSTWLEYLFGDVHFAENST